MQSFSTKWNHLLLFSFGLALGSSLAMKWIESDLLYNGQLISILGLEFSYDAAKITRIFSGIAGSPVKQLLEYHLYFDFVFMAGIFPAIASLCMIAAGKTSIRGLRRVLFGFAFLQLVAWAFDITENYFLLKWLKEPVIGDEFRFFHVVVYTKWSIAVVGVLLSLGTLLINWLRKRRNF